MSYTSRIKQIEKHAGKNNRTVHIEVEDYGSNKVEQKYAKHRARQVLGIRPAFGEQRTRFIVCPETEAKYEDMTVKQAKKMLEGAGKKEA